MTQSKKFHYFWIILLLVSNLLYMSCRSSKLSPVSSGKARLCGRYSKEIYQALEDTSVKIQLVISVPFAEGYTKEEIPLNNDGTFSIDIPVVLNSACQIGLDGYYIWVYLSPGQKTEFEMTKGKSQKRNLKMIRGMGWTEEESKEYQAIVDNIYYVTKKKFDFQPGISTEKYQQHVINNLKLIKKEVDNNTKLFFDLKKPTIQSIKTSYLFFWVLNSIENDTYQIQPLKKTSDFTFLKYFNLNDQFSFWSPNYIYALQRILESKVFQIPPIGDTPIHEWLKGIKSIFADLIGSDTGIFYNLLAANSYTLQLKNEKKPLSDEQIKNIQSYFQNPLYADELLSENEKVIEQLQFKSDIPNGGIDKMIDTIVSQNKGKVVVIDFWATWCRPCLIAMDSFKDIKKEFEKKNVTFVYIAAPTSNREKWEEITRNEKGIHYFLDTEDNWEYLMKKFNFNTIPTYLIYDPDGNLNQRLNNYPGNEKMQEMIENLLP